MKEWLIKILILSSVIFTSLASSHSFASVSNTLKCQKELSSSSDSNFSEKDIFEEIRFLAHIYAVELPSDFEQMWYKNSKSSKVEANYIKQTLLELSKKTLAANTRKEFENAVTTSIEDLKKINEEATLLKRIHKNARAIAIAFHDAAGQTYADKPYSVHLRAVRKVLKRFGLGPKHSILGLKLGTIAWLHDILEDTEMPKNDLIEFFGEEIGSAVVNLSNEPDSETRTQEERKKITFSRVNLSVLSRLVKLADRIANVEMSLISAAKGEVSKIKKYNKEWPLFSTLIKKDTNIPGVEQMWQHLESLLNNPDYAHQFVQSALTSETK